MIPGSNFSEQLSGSVRIWRAFEPSQLIPSLVFYGFMVLFIVFPKYREKQMLTPLDRLSLSLFLLELLLVISNYFFNNTIFNKPSVLFSYS